MMTGDVRNNITFFSSLLKNKEQITKWNAEKREISAKSICLLMDIHILVIS